MTIPMGSEKIGGNGMSGNVYSLGIRTAGMIWGGILSVKSYWARIPFIFNSPCSHRTSLCMRENQLTERK